MAQAKLNRDGEQIDASVDSIVIMQYLEGIPGGKTLDVTGFTPEVIVAGHLIIEETATKELKPMPVNGDATAYASLPTGHSYKGVLVASIATAKPMAAIMRRGTVNEEAFKNVTGLATPSAAKTALTHIIFTQD